MILYNCKVEKLFQKTCGDTGAGVEYTYDSNGNLLEEAGQPRPPAMSTTRRTARFAHVWWTMRHGR